MQYPLDFIIALKNNYIKPDKPGLYLHMKSLLSIVKRLENFDGNCKKIGKF